MKILIEKAVIEQALEALEDLIVYSWNDGKNGEPDKAEDYAGIEAITALREALAGQAEQEPVAWKDLTYGNLHHQDFGNSIPLYAAPVQQAEQEPVAWTRKQFGEDREYCEEPFTTDWKPLYAAPVRTKDLTDDEIVSVLEYYDHEWDETTFAIARAVIAADREKNKC